MFGMAVFRGIGQVTELAQLQDIQHVSERLKNAGNQELLDFQRKRCNIVAIITP